MGKFTLALESHAALQSRRSASMERLHAVRSAFTDISDQFTAANASVFCAGSLGRGDLGAKSDLDFFAIANGGRDQLRRLDELELLARIIQINRELGGGPISNDGQFLKIQTLKEMRTAVGAPSDDSENLFTTRMLMLLESECVCNDGLYNTAISEVVEHYFRDHRGKRSFRPLFLLNDLLRFWRTLCLNYELIRDRPDKPWRKKNINLKFSRMVTVFGTVLPVIAIPVSSAPQVITLTKMSPMARFAYGLDEIGDRRMLRGFQSFLDDYESFLTWKERLGTKELPDDNLDGQSRQTAARFSDFMHAALCHTRISADLRKYLVL